jgi:hypothetical protein
VKGEKLVKKRLAILLFKEVDVEKEMLLNRKKRGS